MPSMLSSLQQRVLAVLSGALPGWTLTGGGALVGYHLKHRRTDDLDLFFHGRDQLGSAANDARAVLEAAGMHVEVLQRSPAFVRLAVTEEGARVVVDLVAEPVATIESPVEVLPGLSIDTPHEILVNKLCALLSRSEPRDLEDVRALVNAGGDLPRALRDAPSKDGGFSPMTLAWVLRTFPLDRAAELGFDRDRLDAFREQLIASLSKD